ncbi:MAG: glycine zipper domain-containing protein [Verrucomicrobiota bacterium]|nr:glycine zipper domain-containing protein [Verrucomicrobiota bacterium]
MKLHIPLVASALLGAFSLSSCETPGQTALLGAGTGAAIGAASGHALRGAAIGAGAGYLVGRVVRHDRERAYRAGYEDRGYESERRYPVARRSGRYGFVESPYPPYNLIDVRGIPRGERVVDPSTGRIFTNP